MHTPPFSSSDPIRLTVFGEEIKFRQIGAAGGDQLIRAALDLIHIQRGDVLVILGAIRQTGVYVSDPCRNYPDLPPERQFPAAGAPRPAYVPWCVAGSGGAGEHNHRTTAAKNFAGCRVHPALVFVFAVAGKAGRAFGSGINQTDFNQSFRNPDSGHRMHWLPSLRRRISSKPSMYSAGYL